MTEEKFCNIHDSHCIQIQRLEQDIHDGKNEVKDTRKSLIYDMERRDTAILKIIEQNLKHTEKFYITKIEFEPIKRLVYGLASLMLAYAAKMVLL